MNFCRLTIQEPIFSVANTEFEGGDDGHGHGDHTFLVKQAQPSHTCAPIELAENGSWKIPEKDLVRLDGGGFSQIA